jgi:hypothetical protein
MKLEVSRAARDLRQRRIELDLFRRQTYDHVVNTGSLPLPSFDSEFTSPTTRQAENDGEPAEGTIERPTGPPPPYEISDGVSFSAPINAGAESASVSTPNPNGCANAPRTGTDILPDYAPPFRDA